MNLKVHWALVISRCRRVAEVDTSLADDMQREINRLRQREKSAINKQKKEMKSFLNRGADLATN